VFHLAAGMLGHQGGEARSGIIQTPPSCVNTFRQKDFIARCLAA